MEVRNLSFDFPSMRGGGPRNLEQAVNFPRQVVNAVAVLTGYSAQFGDNDDHHLGRLEVTTNTEVVADIVKVRVAYGLRDWSGTWDDNYGGLIEVTVFADLEAPGAPARRTDLMITGIETTQAIQHFRSSQHLNAGEGGPDNSIPLIARKDTALRVYVDYSPPPGAAPFAQLSGEVQVQTSSGATLPILPAATISPRADVSIERTLVDHTLNFVIPEAWCQGEIEFSCEVFDSATPALRSMAFRRTLRFIDVAPLSTYAVGINYTGQTPNLAPPSMADAIATLDKADRLFPFGEILVNGYTTIDFGENMNANIADGCGDGFNDLLAKLRDLRGDSEDLYWAVLPAGVVTGSVGGCGSGSGRVAAQIVGHDFALAEEFGHALGRKHAPAGISPAPANPDAEYPTYGVYPSGSIGEIGYDPAWNTVFDPAATFDFMGYGQPEWISPYTFLALMGQAKITGPDTYPSSRRSVVAAHTVAAGEVLRQKHQTLFLRLSISRERKATRDFMFHFPAVPSRPSGVPTEFSLEFLDKDSNVLSCAPLHQLCLHCQPTCWPKRFNQNVTFPDGARWMIIWEDRQKIYEEVIPDPPKILVTAESKKVKDVPGIAVRWQASVPIEDDSKKHDAEGRMYLVQWQDGKGNWRGAAPRSSECALFIPLSHLQLNPRQRKLQIRVLATSGIATGCVEAEISDLEIPAPKNKLILHGEHHISRKEGKAFLSPLIRITTLGDDGTVTGGDNIRWFDEQGRDIGRGRTLDMRRLANGQHVISADAVHLGAGAARASWLVERTESGVRILKRL